MADQSRKSGSSPLEGVMDQLPLDRVKDELGSLAKAWGEKAVSSAGSRMDDLTDRLSDYADGGGGGVKAKALKEGGKAAVRGESPLKGALKGGLSGVKDKAKEAFGGGGSKGGGKGTKATNIIEQIDVGVPVRVAYNQWTEFQDFPHYMKKVKGVEQKSDEKLTFKAQVFWSHRTWEATIIEQVPDDRIVWRSSGAKGHVDGAVTFHELGPHLTRILLVLEYHPQGLFERTGNLWRAQGRRARLAFKHFRRHVMTSTILHPDEVEGWRGEIRDGEVVKTHEDAVAEEQDRDEDQYEEGGEPQDEYDDGEPQDEYDDEGDEEDQHEDEYDDDEGDEEDEPEDEYDDDEGDEQDEPEDEYD